jgi:glyoxylase I family protein
MQAPRVHHVAIKVRDLGPAHEFWSEVLGLSVLREHRDELGLRSIWYELEGSFLALERADSDSGRSDSDSGWHCVALAIEEASREEWRGALEAAGFPVFHSTDYTLYTRDPEGTVVALSHYPSRASRSPDEPHVQRDSFRDKREKESCSSIANDARRYARAAVAALAISVAAVLVTSAAIAQRAAVRTTSTTTSRSPDVLVIGSSSVFGPLGVEIDRTLSDAGLRVQRISHQSTGLARPDFFDWSERVAQLTGLGSMRGVVLALGGNDAMALRLRREESRDRGSASWVAWNDEARWKELYAQRVVAVVEGLCARGARKVVVLPPADGERSGWAERIHRVQDVQLSATTRTSCGHAIDTRGRDVRSGDTLDGVHLGQRASRELLTRIGPRLLSHFR